MIMKIGFIMIVDELSYLKMVEFKNGWKAC
jgi:hypothetical protein